MTFDAIVNIPYAFYKFQTTLKTITELIVRNNMSNSVINKYVT